MNSRKKSQPPSLELMDAERVLINPLNHSLSKQQYTFSKAQRFERCKTQNEDYHYYDLPSTRLRQATTIGKSERDNYSSKNTLSPSPVMYNYAKDGEFAFSVNFKRSKSKGFGFGLGRDVFYYIMKEIKVNSFITVKKDVPDPWSYDPEKAKIKRSKQYSFGKADKSSISKVELPSLVPGPGAYQVNTSLDETKQLLSNHPKTGAPRLMEIKTLGQRIKAIKYPPLCKTGVMKTTRRPPSKAKS